MNRLTRRRVLEVAATGALAAPFTARAAAPTFAHVTINEQALFFNQLNDGAKKAAA